MPRPRDPDRIRADALRLAKEKLVAGCSHCAKEYFDLARNNGATEEAIQAVYVAAQQLGNNPEVSRRRFLKHAAGGALGFAVATSGISPHFTAGVQAAGTMTAVTSPVNATPEHMAVVGTVDGRQVAWICGLGTLTAAGEYQLIGISPSGTLVGQIGPLPAPPLRSADGSHLYVVWPHKQGLTSTTTINMYSTATGVLTHVITGQALSLTRDVDFDSLAMGFSGDGRYLAILHQTRRTKLGTERQFTKVAPSGLGTVTSIAGDTSVTSAVEIIDLQVGRILDYTEFDTSDTVLPSGTIAWAPYGNTLYIFTTDTRFTDSVTVAKFDGHQLRIIAHASHDQLGHVLPTADLLQSRAFRFQEDGASLVRFDSNFVRWFDLASLTLMQELAIDLRQSAKPSVPTGLFSPDGTMLYIWHARSRTLHVVDLVQRTHRGTLVLPMDPILTDPLHRPGVALSTAALSPDGSHLYLSDTEAEAGVVVVHVPDLQILDHHLAEGPVRDLWSAPDGQTVYALGLDEGVIVLLQPNGSVKGMVGIDTSFYGFVTPA